MNLRILKKLSKRAVPLLQAWDNTGLWEHYLSERGDGNCDVSKVDRKHWSRIGRSVLPSLKLMEGTPVVGWTGGYETPEWEERTAWGLLMDQVDNENISWVKVGETEFGDDLRPVKIRRLRNPAQILHFARGLTQKTGCSVEGAPGA